MNKVFYYFFFIFIEKFTLMQVRVKGTGNNHVIIKELDTEKRFVSGYLSVFDVEDSDKDIILAGAFVESIRQNFRRIKFLREHDYQKPIGRFLTLKEDSYGLFFEAQLNKTREGLDALALYENGELFEHSIGFIPIDYEVMQETKGIIFKKVKLIEGSAVLWAANERAVLMELKSQSEFKDNINQQIINILKSKWKF
jgi:HK97 family phage prohead protease